MVYQRGFPDKLWAHFVQGIIKLRQNRPSPFFERSPNSFGGPKLCLRNGLQFLARQEACEGLVKSVQSVLNDLETGIFRRF